MDISKQKNTELQIRLKKLEFENKMLRAEMDIIRPKKKDQHRINYK